MTAARGFGSDNHAGILPEVLAAIAAANEGHAPSYGHDERTAAVAQRFREIFGDGAETFLVFNGTGANVVALRALLRPWEGVVCAETAHLNVDEGGAPEALAGIKLLAVATPDGKLTPELVRPKLARFGDEHAVQPRVLSISQSTEMGTVYAPEEIRALADLAHEQGLLLHVDGARLTNAAAALGPAAARADHGRGGRRAVLRRDEGRDAGGRGRRAVAPGRGGRRDALPAQAVDAARVEDALHRGAVRCPARRASCGAARRATPTRWPPGSPTRSRASRASR